MSLQWRGAVGDFCTGACNLRKKTGRSREKSPHPPEERRGKEGRAVKFDMLQSYSKSNEQIGGAGGGRRRALGRKGPSLGAEGNDACGTGDDMLQSYDK